MGLLRIPHEPSDLDRRIPSGGVRSLQITGRSISTEKMQLKSVRTEIIDDLAVDTAKINDLAVVRAKISELAVGTAQIDDLAVTSAKIAELTVGEAQIQDASITRAKIGEAAVGSAEIEHGSIKTVHIELEAIDESLIADASITSAKIHELAVGTAHIADLAVSSLKIGDYAITTDKLGDLVVTEIKIDDEAVSTQKIQMAAITTALIDDASITEAKIHDLSVSRAKIVEAAIGEAQIADLSVTTAKIVDGAITNAKIDELDAGKIKTGTLDADLVRVVGGGGSVVIDNLGLVVNDGVQDLVAVGNISGRTWKGQPLPSGSYGLWAPDGYIAVSNSAFKQITDTLGTSTTQRFDYVDIPGFSVEFELSEPCMVFMMMSIEAVVTPLFGQGPSELLESQWRLVLNDTEVSGSRRSLKVTTVNPEVWTMWGTISAISVTNLNPGEYELKGQFGWLSQDAEALAFHRTLGVVIFRR